MKEELRVVNKYTRKTTREMSTVEHRTGVFHGAAKRRIGRFNAIIGLLFEKNNKTVRFSSPCILALDRGEVKRRLQILHDFELTPGAKRKDILNKPLPRTPPHTPENTLMDPFVRPILEVRTHSNPCTFRAYSDLLRHYFLQ